MGHSQATIATQLSTLSVVLIAHEIVLVGCMYVPASNVKIYASL